MILGENKIFLRNLRKGVDKRKNIVYNVGTKEREANKDDL